MILIIGAGISGLMAATHLKENGLNPIIIDKGRGVGGRLATRRIHDIPFDHGAQYFTARDPHFLGYLRRWQEQGLVEPWPQQEQDELQGSLSHDAQSAPEAQTSTSPSQFQAGSINDEVTSDTRYVVPGGMTQLAKTLAAPLDVRINSRVTRLERFTNSAEKVIAHFETGDPLKVDAVILTCPVPQSLALFSHSAIPVEANVPGRLKSIEYAPCLALMVLTDAPNPLPEPGGVYPDSPSPIGWIANNGQKGVSGTGTPRTPNTALTIQASPEASRNWWEWEDHDIEQALLDAASGYLHQPVVETQLKRWRYSLVETPLRSSPGYFVASQNPIVILAGDGFTGPRVESAAVSGLEAAKHLLSVLPHHISTTSRPSNLKGAPVAT